MKKNFTLLMLLIMSCNEQEIMQKDKTIDSLITENTILKRNLNEQLSSKASSSASSSSHILDNHRVDVDIKQPENKTTYAYCAFYWIKSGLEGGSVVSANAIKEFPSWNEDIKYRFIEESRNNFMNSGEATLFMTKLTKVKCLSFPTYSKASMSKSKTMHVEEAN